MAIRILQFFWCRNSRKNERKGEEKREGGEKRRKKARLPRDLLHFLQETKEPRQDF